MEPLASRSSATYDGLGQEGLRYTGRRSAPYRDKRLLITRSNDRFLLSPTEQQRYLSWTQVPQAYRTPACCHPITQEYKKIWGQRQEPGSRAHIYLAFLPSWVYNHHQLTLNSEASVSQEELHSVCSKEGSGCLLSTHNATAQLHMERL